MTLTQQYAVDAARPEPKCAYCGGTNRREGGVPVKLTLHMTIEPQQSDIELHRECIWPYLDIHPTHALSRFPI